MFIKDLETIIANRDEFRPSGSYTTDLFTQGLDRILRKVGEESGEVLIAAKNEDKTALTGEICDLLYHLLVMMRAKHITLQDVEAELKKRHT